MKLSCSLVLSHRADVLMVGEGWAARVACLALDGVGDHQMGVAAAQRRRWSK